MKRVCFALLGSIMWLSVAANVLPRVSFVSPSIVRVQWVPAGELVGNGTTVCVYEPQQVRVEVTEREGVTAYRTSELTVLMDGATGALTFVDRRTGRTLLSESRALPRTHEVVVHEQVTYDEATARMVETANGKVTVKEVLRRDTTARENRFTCYFDLRAGEAVYGLGAHMEGDMNLRGKRVYLCQHNLKTMVPVLQSTGGYGLLFDAGCAMIYADSLRADGSSVMALQMEAAHEVDYYFMKGASMDDVVGQYRLLTGAVPMLPRYMTGYVQSRERYVSSHDILSTLSEFRQRQIPIDVIVQDWNYWPEGWGYAKMDRRYYPDPKALADSVHALDAHLMISVWPNPMYCPQEREFRQAGLMLEHSVYDAFSDEGRDMYWRHINDEFFSQGFDAWWCDCSEPVDADWKWMPEGYGWDSHKERWERNTQMLSEVCGAERSQLFSLFHSRGIYEHQRATSDVKRVVNLTRSGYAGQQRYGTINWNGDTHASWPSFRRQIPAGLNYMATGNPYWTVDVGCFFTRSDGRWFYKGQYAAGNADPAYRELYTRMLQWATFLPVLRSHGTDTQREPWFFGEPGTPYYDAIREMIDLRYRLTPYTYSLAAMQTLDNYTMARMLAFDFATDTAALDIKDEYMYGRVLVCPVTEQGATSRRVYLPMGADGKTVWVDFWTGEVYEGGQWIVAEAPIHRLPLFVRGGSIIPSTEVAQHTGAQRDLPIIVNVYPGADATFTLYDDEGDGYRYEQGAYATVELRWDDARRVLHIGKRRGSFEGMPAERTFIIRTPWGEKQLTYKGKGVKVAAQR